MLGHAGILPSTARAAPRKLDAGLLRHEFQDTFSPADCSGQEGKQASRQVGSLKGDMDRAPLKGICI